MKFSNDPSLEDVLKICDSIPTTFFSYAQVLSCLTYLTNEEVKSETQPPSLLSSDEQDEDINSQQPSKKPHSSKKSIPFSDEETKALVKGIKKYGFGKWTIILKKYKTIFEFNHLTPDSLRSNAKNY
jgi:hypothetical protein